MARHPHKHFGFTTQQGSALVVSLLILLVLTLIGVTSMSTTSLQGKMAANSRESNLALQAAESALRSGESELGSATPPEGYDDACDNGLCLPSTTGTPQWSTINWATNARSYNIVNNAALPEIPATLQPKYIIEKMPPASLPGDAISNLGNYGGGSGLQYYRITASATGANGSAAVMLQSVYQ